MKYFTLIFFILPFFSCKQATVEQDGKGKYFEGFVEFNNSCKGQDSQFVISLIKVHGVKTITYLGGDGSFARENIDSNAIITSREIYRPDSAKTYSFKSDSETIFCTSVLRQNSSEMISLQKQPGFTILNHPVDIITIKRPVRSKKTGLEYDIYSTYYNDVTYTINPLTYKKYLRTNIEEIFTKCPHITTGYKIVHGDRATFISFAKRIVPAHVDPLHFEIPKNKVIIEY